MADNRYELIMALCAKYNEFGAKLPAELEKQRQAMLAEVKG